MNTDMKYNEIIEMLKNTEPVLDDAEGLTDRIMQQVEQTTIHTGRVRAMRVSGIISGVAASALICLLAYEMLKYPVIPVESYFSTEWTSVEKEYPRKITEHSIQEKKEIIENIIKNKEAQLVRKEQLIASFTAITR